MIKVKDVQDAWETLKRIYPTSVFEEDERGTFICTDVLTPVAYVINLNSRLEVNLNNGLSYNIWIEDAEKACQKFITAIIGVISETKIFSNVTINEVKEIKYCNVIGFTYEALSDGKAGVVIHLLNNETASFHANSIAYIKTE